MERNILSLFFQGWRQVGVGLRREGWRVDEIGVAYLTITNYGNFISIFELIL